MRKIILKLNVIVGPPFTSNLLTHFIVHIFQSAVKIQLELSLNGKKLDSATMEKFQKWQNIENEKNFELKT